MVDTPHGHVHAMTWSSALQALTLKSLLSCSSHSVVLSLSSPARSFAVHSSSCLGALVTFNACAHLGCVNKSAIDDLL